MTSNITKRKAYLAHLSTAINKLKTAIEEKSNEETVLIYLEQVNVKFQRVEETTAIIQDGLEEDELIADIDKMDEVENHVTEIKVRANTYIEKSKKLTPEPIPPPFFPQPQQLSAKLPEAKLQDLQGTKRVFLLSWITSQH